MTTDPVQFALGFIFVSGLVSMIFLGSLTRVHPAYQTIDHPHCGTRWMYRVFAYCTCQFWSFFLSFGLMGAFRLYGVARDIREATPLLQAAAALTIPLPLTCLLL